jgi:hypothetical protein
MPHQRRSSAIVFIDETIAPNLLAPLLVDELKNNKMIVFFGGIEDEL